MTTPDNRDRYRWLGRLLEMVPGTISWAVLILPLWLSFSYPWLVAYFVLSFDFYWLCRALWFSGAVIVAYRRIRRVVAVDWSQRVAGLETLTAQRADIQERVGAGAAPSGTFGISFSGRVDRAERRRARQHDEDRRRVMALPSPPPSADEYIHLALIPTYTESLEKLRHTVG